MKNIKSIWYLRIAVVLAIAFCATACLKEDIIRIAAPMPQGKMIRFNIERGWNDEDALTKSGASEYGVSKSKHILVSEDKSESIEMGVYQQANDNWFETETKGTMVQAAQFNEFMAFGYKTKNNTTETMFTTYHKKGDDMWETPEQENSEEGYYWPGADYTCSFFGIAMSDNKLTDQSFYSNVQTTTNSSGQIVSFDYTVPDSSEGQSDIMVASATGLPGDGSEGAVLNFKHILTAVNIKVGETMQNGTIESIKFKNIYGKATYNIQSGIWSGLREFNQLHEYSVNLGSGFDTTVSKPDAPSSQTNTQINATNATFMVIPQTLPTNAEIEIMFKHAGAANAISIKGSLAGTSWPQGRVVNYLINVKPDGNLVFTSTVVAQDAHYVIVPLTIKANNLKEGWTIESDSEAVTLKSELSTLQQQGYWTVNELGSQTLSGTTAGNEIKVYAFLEENLSTENRNFTLSLKNKATGEVVDTKTITQLGMSSARSERIEETSYVPWGFKWDRKVVYTAKPTITNIFNINWRDLFAAPLFEYIANNVAEQYPEAVNSGVLKVEREEALYSLGMSINTVVTVDYSKLSSLGNVAQSTTAGEINSESLYYFQGISQLSDIETLLDTQKKDYPNGVTKEVAIEGNASSLEDFAVKSCAMKNKFYAETITASGAGQSVSYKIPVLSSDLTNDASDNFDYFDWYLPAQNQYSAIETAEGTSAYQLNGIYWTSTAVSNDNINSYIYTPGGTGVGTDDRMKTHLVRCMRRQ